MHLITAQRCWLVFQPFSNGNKNSIWCSQTEWSQTLASSTMPWHNRAWYPRISIYLWANLAAGGGARSITVIAKEWFKQVSVCYEEAQAGVLDAQMHEHKWRNDHQMAVCSPWLSPNSTEHDNDKHIFPCSSCANLFIITTSSKH